MYMFLCFFLTLQNMTGKDEIILSRTHHNSSFLFTNLKHYVPDQLTAFSGSEWKILPRMRLPELPSNPNKIACLDFVSIDSW